MGHWPARRKVQDVRSGLQRPSRDMGIWKKHLGSKPGTVPLCYCRSPASLTSFEPLMSHHSHHSHHSCPLPVSHPPVEKEEAGRNVQSQGDASAGLAAWIRPKMLLILALCGVCQESLHPVDNTGYSTLGTGHSAPGQPVGDWIREGDHPVAHADGRRRRTP